MAQYEEGQTFAHFVRPLGQPSDLIHESIEELKAKNIIFIAGGVGIAPVYVQVKWLHENGIDVDVIVGRTVTLDELMKEEGFDAVFIGLGAGLPKFMGISRGNLNGVFSANEFLTRNNLMKVFKEDYDTPIKSGKKVAVVGVGNVAMDSARTALRLGSEVHIVYRKSKAELLARVEEVHHAKEEGALLDIRTNPTEIIGDENGWVKGMKCVRMELGESDASGRRKPVVIKGSEFVMDVDTVIMSLGTSPNLLISSTTKGLEINKHKCIVAEEEIGLISRQSVYAGGDAVTYLIICFI